MTSGPSSYPRPVVPLHVPSCTTRSLFPLETPPPCKDLPQLPCAPRRVAPNAPFTLTTHLVPAAYPRSTPYVPLPSPPTWTKDKQRWRSAITHKVDELISAKQQQLEGKLDSPPSRAPLWVCVNRYVRKAPQSEDKADRRSVTLFFAHATGYTKEIWEPVISHLFASGTRTYTIDEIWSWEAVSNGDSAIVNANNLGGLYDWKDSARDILHFLLHYLPCSSSSATLPVHLPRLPESISEQRKSYGFAKRNLVCVGHSNGGSLLIHAGVAQPSLFSSIVLVDPAVLPPPGDGPYMCPGSYNIIVDVMQRRDRWRSSDEARSSFAKAEYFQRWDPAVFDVFVENSLCDDGQGGVKLKMAPIHEAIVLADAQSQYEAWMLLANIPARIGLLWVMPGLPLPDTVIPPQRNFEVRQNMVWQRPQNMANVRIEGTSHLLLHEAPMRLAQEIDAYLARTYGVKTKL